MVGAGTADVRRIQYLGSRSRSSPKLLQLSVPLANTTNVHKNRRKNVKTFALFIFAGQSDKVISSPQHLPGNHSTVLCTGGFLKRHHVNRAHRAGFDDGRRVAQTSVGVSPHRVISSEHPISISGRTSAKRCYGH